MELPKQVTFIDLQRFIFSCLPLLIKGYAFIRQEKGRRKIYVTTNKINCTKITCKVLSLLFIDAHTRERERECVVTGTGNIALHLE